MSFTPYHMDEFARTGEGVVHCWTCDKDYVYRKSSPECPSCERDRINANNDARIRKVHNAQWDQYYAQQAAYNRQSNVIGWMVCALVLIVTVACVVLMSIR